MKQENNLVANSDTLLDTNSPTAIADLLLAMRESLDSIDLKMGPPGTKLGSSPPASPPILSKLNTVLASSGGAEGGQTPAKAQIGPLGWQTRLIEVLGKLDTTLSGMKVSVGGMSADAFSATAKKASTRLET